MSKSSNAVFSGFFQTSMRHAAPILFCIAIAIAVLTFVGYSAAYLIPSVNDSTDTVTRIYLGIDGLIRGLTEAALPFIGAAIVWALQDRAAGETK